MKTWRLLALAVVVLLAGILLPMAVRGADLTPVESRAAFAKGNYKDAYDGLAPKVLSEAGTDQLSADFDLCIGALNNLGRADEMDEFREKAIAAHAKQWDFLQTAARSFRNEQHYGVIIAGVFHRGGNRNGDGKWVSALDRDRVRALQLMEQVTKVLALAKVDPGVAAAFYFELAEGLLMGDQGRDAWRLQTLTDLTKLPDYDETARPYYYGGWAQARGAPVDDAGKPVFHHLPKGGWVAAKTDGERWRWALLQASELSPTTALQSKMVFGEFLESQFGVQTMAEYGALFNGANGGEDGKKNESGPFAVFTLKDNETIAKLANGIKRFDLPEEFNPIKVYESVAADAKGGSFTTDAMAALARVYTNRQQYNTAAEWWKKALALEAGTGIFHAAWHDALDQIEGNWGQFENTLVQPVSEGAGAGDKGATLDFRFRNGKHAAFTVQEIDVPLLLEDMKTHVRAKPAMLDSDTVNLSQIGYRLVEKNQTKYLKGEVTKWEMALEPRENHFDKRITVETPVKKPGAYLVTGTMAGGNTTRIVMWLNDTVIVQKPLAGKSLTYVADAVTGQAVPGATVEFFGWRQQWIQDRVYRIDTQEFAQTANGDGEVIVPVGEGAAPPLPPVDSKNPLMVTGLQWLTVAKTPAAGGGGVDAGGRFAFIGMSNIWQASLYDQYDAEYNQQKAYLVTDRPVYRPGQKVQFKLWVGHNKYDEDGKSPYAGSQQWVALRDPRGEIIARFHGTADEWGGAADGFELSSGATLGVYTLTQHFSDPTPDAPSHGAISFRVEEYKKPEFEVKVDAPTEPVMLGERISATITAKYYFGSPVTNAMVKYKVTRTTHDARWYPAAAWDWFYEPGYWWFASDYLWYPGFDRWGMRRPIHVWWGGWSPEQPEVISENQVPVGADGTVKVEIDTAVAKAAYGDKDHKYSISAEVTDASRRTITGSGDVLVARDPFKVYAWVDRGHYQVGETVRASFSAQTLDNKPVSGKGALKLLHVTYDAKGVPTETQVQAWDLNTNEQGTLEVQIHAESAGQFRLSYAVTDAKNHRIEGGYIFTVRGDAVADGRSFRFNDVEIITDKKEYKAGEKVKLLINANRADATVLLFLRPANGVYQEPKVIALKGKSAVEEVEVGKKDMPNFFIEALTVSDAKVHTEVREVIVPPEDRVLNVAVTSDQSEYKPGQKATLTVKVTEKNGEPFTGSVAVSLYDKAVEYISGGPNAADIRKYFWQWRRTHNVNQQTSLDIYSPQVLKSGERGLEFLGVFGEMSALDGQIEKGLKSDKEQAGQSFRRGFAVGGAFGGGGRGGGGGGGGFDMDRSASAAAPMASSSGLGAADMREEKSLQLNVQAQGVAPDVQPEVRSNFADTALWAPTLVTSKNGTATVDVTMPENLTTWKARVWSLGNGSRVGQGDAEMVTRKNLIVRLEAPRFFVQTDEVVISTIVHNYLKTRKSVRVDLKLPSAQFGLITPDNDISSNSTLHWSTQRVDIDPQQEARLDWRVKVHHEGTATITASATTDEESDAMQMSFPVYVHGMLKTDSFAGALRPDPANPNATLAGIMKMIVPNERRPEQTLLEVRYSPSLATAMVDALPYMANYPYGCTEQTLNRFVPTVITQKVLLDMKLDLKAIRDKRTNLNAQEIGDPAKRAAQWKHYDIDPVFDEAKVKDMVRDGVAHLGAMQLSDGGWGWFSGSSEMSMPHTTAVVVHGLQIAKENGAAVDAAVLDRGVQWLEKEEYARLAWIMENRAQRKANDMDAFVYMVLADAGRDMAPMREILFEDRAELQVYTKAMLGLAMLKVKDSAKLQVLLENCKQYLVQDDENQTAYLKMPAGIWWYWYGSEFEAQACYLKLLAKTDPKGQDASRLAKYLINNRRNATYWNSTRDTADCIEALADYIRASGEDHPDMTVHVALDGQEVKTVKINTENLFAFDNLFTVAGAALPEGSHSVQISREGAGPLYYTAYLSNFTLEDSIKRAGLEIKVNRTIYKLTPADKTVQAQGEHGQAVDKKVEKWNRTALSNGQSVQSGDLVEVELTVDSKNDYEYILIEDMKAAGFEPVEVRSGYNGNDMGAYVEFRDDRVSFFVRTLGRGTHSVSYRLRAEVPGSFSALPAKASAMYAPELRANSDEVKLHIADAALPGAPAK